MSQGRSITILFALLALAGCTGESASKEAEAADTAAVATAPLPVAVPLTGGALLRRVSLDLRGVLPTLQELDQIEANPDSLDEFVDAWLADPRFEDQFSAAFAERWLTRADTFTLHPIDLGLSEAEAYTGVEAIGQEAPRLAAWIAVENRPWDEVVSGEFTRVNALLLENWPVELVDEEVSASGWRTARYVDGRPALGVLATNGLWQRYSTSPSNLQRHRAAAVSKLFLCNDFLSRPVSFSAESLGSDDPETSARQAPECVGCHAALDPLASNLFGFWWFDRFLREEEILYHPERVGLGEIYLDAAPAWYGTPLSGPEELGPTIAADPRFLRCAVESFAEVYWKREVGLADFDTVTAMAEAFDADGRRPHTLIRAVLADPAYRVGDVEGELAEAERGQWPSRRLLSVGQMGSVVEDLSGFKWTWEGYDQLNNDVIGYRVIGGGVDGESALRPLTEPSVATMALLRTLAEATGDAVVTRDLRGGAGELLTVDSATVPGDTAFTLQLDAVYRRLYARLPTAEERAGDEALWAEVAALGTPEEAWTALLSTLIRDPAFWTY
jgi:hypothetical protein